MNARHWWTVGALWLVALAAVGLLVSVSAARRAGPGPVAPGLAALDDHRLAELLPARGEFPADWRVKSDPGGVGVFGYWDYHPEQRLGAISPAECYEVAYGAYPATDAVGVGADHRTDRPHYTTPIDVRIDIARDFHPGGFDALVERVYRCREFSGSYGAHYRVQVLDDTHRTGGPQLFRYTVTTDYGGRGGRLSTDQYSYARTSHLLLTGRCEDGQQRLCDRLLAQTLGRIQALGG